MSDQALPVLLNPAAGSGAAVRIRERLEAELRSRAIAFTLTVTESEGHLRRLTRKLATENEVLAGAGGDSTFLIMVDEIMAAGARPRLGLIGIGSSNDIPREFGIETLDKACLALAGGNVRSVDVGFVEDGEKPGPRHYFLGQANIGIGAAVNLYVAGLAGRGRRLARRQTLAGFLGILKAYRSGQIPLQLAIDSAQGSGRGSYVAAVFANNRFWATGRIIAPDARPDDGALDACLIGACSIRRLARVNALAKSGRHGARPEVEMLRSVEFQVSSDKPFLVQTDGEIIRAAGRPAHFTRARIGLVPAALKIFAPGRP